MLRVCLGSTANPMTLEPLQYVVLGVLFPGCAIAGWGATIFTPWLIDFDLPNIGHLLYRLMGG